jgi:hypothetical protein
MDLFKFKFDGLYDSRTLQELKNQGVSHFSFDFNPRSFNFIPERVFLNLLKNDLNETDKIFLHFTHNRDFMVQKIFDEILKIRESHQNIYFEFDEFFSDTLLPDQMQCVLHYRPSIFLVNKHFEKISGFIFPIEILERSNKENSLINFYSNFCTYFQACSLESKFFILQLGWNEVPSQKCIEVFDFDLIGLPLNKEIEVCYRNIDFNKLNTSFESRKKYFLNNIVNQEL